MDDLERHICIHLYDASISIRAGVRQVHAALLHFSFDRNELGLDVRPDG